jgi:arylsulfatase A-like enzyme
MRVTTSICMTSRATLLTGQYMSRHGIDRFGKAIEPAQWRQTYPALLREAGYWTGFVGKYGVGAMRAEDFDFARSYEGRHWFDIKGEKIHVTERNARDSLQFLAERPKDKPFCLSVSFFAAHAQDNHPDQYLPQDWSAKFYEGVTIPRSELADEQSLRALPPFLQAEANEGRVRFAKRFDTPEKHQRYMTNYFRLITEVDEAIGRIVAELKQQGVYENTLIIFTGDNGYFHADRGLADKWYPYEESIRVPLIVRDPRMRERGVAREARVLNIDVAPTIVAAAGVAVPPAMQGSDLSVRYLTTVSGPAARDEFFYEHPTISRRERIPTSHAVVTPTVKYTHWPEWDYEELYDLRTDPLEERNLVSESAAAELLSQMRAKLEHWQAATR